MGARFNNNLFVYTPHNLENIFQAFKVFLGPFDAIIPKISK